MSALEIVSIVATGNLGREFDLESLSEDLTVHSTEYNPEKSPGLLIKFYPDGPSISIFRTGSCNIRGAKDLEEITEHEVILDRKLSEIGIDVPKPNFELTNIVFTANLNKTLDLNETLIQLGLDSVEYEPEQFPGLVYRPEDHECVMLIFATGNVVITGAKNKESAESAFSDLYHFFHDQF